MLERGLVQIYTGQGKGKTTAAFGQALRAAGHGARVLIWQFLKPSDLKIGERLIIQSHLEGITLRCLDEPWDMFRSMRDQAQLERVQNAVHEALLDIEAAAHDKLFDLIVLDEIVFCLSQQLASMDDVRRLIETRDPHVELVLTGQGASAELIDMADLVTEMRPIKHPYERGIAARKGIEY